jgi:hypothetical protein
VIAIPVTLPQSFWNNEVERVSDRFVADKAEDPLGARIPKINYTITVGRDDCI